RDARQVGGEGRVEGGRLAGEQGRQGVVSRLGRRRLGRGAAGGVDVGVVGLERPVDGDDRVGHGRLGDRQGAGDEHRAEPRLPDGVYRQLIPFEDDVGRQQAPVLQQLDAGRTLLPESHGEISFGLPYGGSGRAAGAQTERRGGAGPAGGVLGGKGPAGRF